VTGGWGRRAARLRVMAGLMLLGGVRLAMSPAQATPAERISLPYACKVEHGRLRLEPGIDQTYPILGPREQRPFTVCRDRQSCRTLTVHRFTVACGSQRVAWADIASRIAEKGHSKFAVADGQLGVWTNPRPGTRAEQAPSPPPSKVLNGWCSDQFGGPTQPFLRQACQEARRFMSNLGGPTLEPTRPPTAAPLFIAMPKGFAPLTYFGARLLQPLPIPSAAPNLAAPAPPEAQVEAAALVVPKLSAPEPNERPTAAPPGHTQASAQLATGTASNWITSVHLASATVAASSEAAAERQRGAAQAQTLNFVLVLAGVLAAVLAAAAFARHRRNTQLASSATVQNAPHLTTPRLSAPERSDSATQQRGGLLLSRLGSQLSALPERVHKGLTRGLVKGLARVQPTASPKQRPALTPEQMAELAALSPDDRLIMTAREQLLDRIDTLQQTIAPLARTAPALQIALSRDLLAGERRLAKVTVASLVPTSIAPDEVAQKRAHSRLQRVTADLDRLQGIIAGAVASLSRNDSLRPLPRDLPEAYLVLGVNDGVSLSTLKKLVDALRVSWHPDLATSDDDRRHRDERIKEINVAWDLILGKRGVS
jgi:hypothetical protein